MRRTALLALIAFLAAIAAAFGARAQAGTADVALTQTKGVRFPDRAFVLRVPNGYRVEPGGVSVFENGDPVLKLAVTPASGVRRAGQFGTVLAIDASKSMRGDPIRAALEAARSFAAQRNFNQALAIVTFSDHTDVRLGFTRDSQAIDAALATTPTLGVGTRLYDAVGTALDLLRASRIRSGSIVLLSDGRDIGSSATAEEATRLASTAGVRIFTVGLKSRQFSPDQLKFLADETGGSYSAASSSDDLARIYQALGYRLANEYLLEYKSLAGPQQDVQVAVRLAGVEGIATASYRTPKLPAPPPSSFHRSPLDEVLQSWMTMLIIALLAAALVGLAAVVMFRPRERGFLARLGAFVSVARPAPAPRQTAVLSEKLLETTERSLRRQPWWARFKEDVEIGDLPLPAEQIVVLTAMGTILFIWVLSIFLPLPIALLGIGAPLVVNGLVRRQAERNRRRFADQLPDNLQVLSSALRAGHSLIGALAVVVDDAPEPSRREFRRVVADEQLGVPLEDTMTVVAERMKSRDLEQVAVVARLQRQTGGNSAEVLDRVAETIRDRAALRRLVRTLTAQGRMARWVLSAIPVGLLLLITAMNRQYMHPLFSKPAGQVMLVVAALMVVTGSYVIKRIVDIKV